MGHGPATQWEKDASTATKTKYGIILFLIYCVVYAGFVVINTVTPKTMGVIIFSGLNLAVVYGFGLIIFAIVLGLIYNQICSNAEAAQKEIN
jgi:uncharacterized membrane protein (DUF485 family)